MSAESTITCPECGTRNRPGSVFCAECGARLPLDDRDDANATASFSPLTESRDPATESWAPDDAGTTQIFTPRVDLDGAASSPIDVSPWSTPPVTAPAAYPGDPGRRGFVLGIIAAILILLVFGFYLWATVASDGFRDAVTGVF